MASHIPADDVHSMLEQLTELLAALTHAAHSMTEKASALHTASQYEMAHWATERECYWQDMQAAAGRIIDARPRWWLGGRGVWRACGGEGSGCASCFPIS